MTVHHDHQTGNEHLDSINHNTTVGYKNRNIMFSNIFPANIASFSILQVCNVHLPIPI